MKHITFALMLLVVTSAHASSPEAWDEFRNDVESKCLIAAESYVRAANVTVDPFGSEEYGVAIVLGESKDSHLPLVLACLYNKQSHEATLYAETLLPLQDVTK
jgi:hypothetical protein